jgi:hypothetical protein
MYFGKMEEDFCISLLTARIGLNPLDNFGFAVSPFL